MGKVISLRVRSFAKVNLGLEVLAPRSDGYHELRTLFQTVDLCDDLRLALRPRSPEITVACDHPLVPTDESNLAHKAARELRRFARKTEGVAIEIEKRIPVGGGLGGGSSNAAVVLLALDRLWKLGLGRTGLHPLARRLGADVPYFLAGGTALGLGRGDEVYPLHRQLDAHVVIANPGRSVSTAAVFRRISARLTPRENSNSIFLFVSRDLEGKAGWPALTNDLEEAAFEEAPGLRAEAGRIRRLLVREGARLAALSGSGSSYFGVYGDPRAARRAVRALREGGVVAWQARTLSVDQYQREWSSSVARRG